MIAEPCRLQVAVNKLTAQLFLPITNHYVYSYYMQGESQARKGPKSKHWLYKFVPLLTGTTVISSSTPIAPSTSSGTSF